jgi:alkyl hydroperoxide reductase subunit F
MYDLIIVGGGPAGSAAAVYAARKQLKTLFLTAEWGGQSIVSPDIQNWIGIPHISGDALAKSLRAHVEAYAGDSLTIVAPRKAVSLMSSHEASIAITDDKGDTYEAKAALITTGSIRRKLEVPGADIFDQKGLTYCASCDGPLYAGQDVVVVGGGNAAFETAAQLLAYVKSVTMINRGDSYRADAVTIQKVLSHTNMRSIQNAEPQEVIGGPFVTGIRYKDMLTGAETTLPVTGIFVEIGLIPNTAWVGTAVALNVGGHIVTDPRTQRTSNPQIWSAGDCTDAPYHQNNIATGDAVKAIEDIYASLHAR